MTLIGVAGATVGVGRPRRVGPGPRPVSVDRVGCRSTASGVADAPSAYDPLRRHHPAGSETSTALAGSTATTAAPLEATIG